MATLTIHNLDDDVSERLAHSASSRGRSVEDEAREILTRAVGSVSGPELWALSRQLFSNEDGIDLVLPKRADDRGALDFSDLPRAS